MAPRSSPAARSTEAGDRGDDAPRAFLATSGELTDATNGEPFVAVALVVPARRLGTLRAAVDAIRAAHAGAGPLTPALLDASPDRFRDVVEAIAALDFRFVGLAIDPREVDAQTRQICREPAARFASRLLARQLFSFHPRLVAHAVVFGANHFLTQYATYLARDHVAAGGPTQLDIFAAAVPPPALVHVSATQEPLMQAAAIIATVVGRAFGDHDGAPVHRSFLEPLARRGAIDLWPTVRDDAHAPSSATATADDRAVLRLARAAAETFFRRHQDDVTPAAAMRLSTLKMLVYRQLVDPEGSFVPAGELEDHLLALGHEPPGKGRWIGRAVIGALRDEGVLVASGPTGYRLPSSVADLRAWVGWNESMLGPMVKRLAKVRERVQRATEGRVDLLAGEAHTTTRAAVDSVPVEPAEESPPR